MKAISIRIQEKTAEIAETIYGAKVTGCQNAVEAFFEIRKRTINEVKGIFTEQEISAIADNLNGSLFETKFACNPEMLLAHVQDGNLYDGLFAKWAVDSAQVEKKIKALTSAQCYVLIDIIRLFWGIPNPEIPILIEVLR